MFKCPPSSLLDNPIEIEDIVKTYFPRARVKIYGSEGKAFIDVYEEKTNTSFKIYCYDDMGGCQLYGRVHGIEISCKLVCYSSSNATPDAKREVIMKIIDLLNEVGVPPEYHCIHGRGYWQADYT